MRLPLIHRHLHINLNLKAGARTALPHLPAENCESCALRMVGQVSVVYAGETVQPIQLSLGGLALLQWL